MNIIKRVTKDNSKASYTREWGRGQGERIAPGIYTYIRPKNIEQKTRNTEALKLLQTKKSQLIIEQQRLVLALFQHISTKAIF